MFPSHQELLELAHAKMPYGKFQNRYLSDLPEFYLVWYRQKGFPAGKLGKQLQIVYEMQLNGLEGILVKIRKENPIRR